MSERIAAELDRYERRVARAVGSDLARERRRELESHLRAAIESRRLNGMAETQAETEAIGALGDLDRLARAERRRRRPVLLAHVLLLAAPLLVWAAFLTQPGVGREVVFPTWAHPLLFGSVMVGIVVGAGWARWAGVVTLTLGIFAGAYAVDALIEATGLMGRRGMVPGPMDQAVAGLSFFLPLYVVGALLPLALSARLARRRA